MKILCLIWVLVWSVIPATATEIEGRIKGERFDWLSAQRVSSNFTPSAWDLPLHLPPAERVVPGGVTTASSHIEFKQINGDGKISLPFTLIGIQYRLSDYQSSKEYRGGDSSATTIARGSDIVEVIGSGIGSMEYTLNRVSTPFTHHRPLFRMHESTWMNSMKGQPSGTYRGVLNYTILYNYYRNGIIVRNTLQASLVVTLEYAPALLTSVRFISKNDVIAPQYHGYPDRMVGGRTEYQIEAKGVFPGGVLMGLRPLTGRASQYQLDSLSTENESFITYSVNCDFGCNKPNIITDGRADIDMAGKRLIISSGNGTTATATISVVLTNTKLEGLSNDTYRGSFVLMFSAGL